MLDTDTDTATPEVLVGKFFVKFSNGRLGRTGHILGTPSAGLYLVQLFNFFGDASIQVFTKLEDMIDYRFYNTIEHWRDDIRQICEAEDALLRREHGLPQRPPMKFKTGDC